MIATPLNPSSTPLAQKPKEPIRPMIALLLGVAVLGIGYYFIIQPQIDIIQASRAEIEQLKQDTATTVIQRQKFEKDVSSSEAQVQNALYQTAIPTGAATNELLASLETTLSGTGKIDGLTLGGVITDDKGIMTIPVSIGWHGSYSELKGLISRIHQSRRVLSVQTTRVLPSEGGVSAKIDLSAFGINPTTEKAANGGQP